MRSEGTAPSRPTDVRGNYVKFTGLTLPGFTLTGDANRIGEPDSGPLNYSAAKASAHPTGCVHACFVWPVKDGSSASVVDVMVALT